MPDLTPETLAELRRLLAEATPRPWIAEVSGTTGPVVMDAQSVSAFDHVAKCPHYRGSADSELIATAVNALPGLLDALEKAEGHRDSLAATLIEVQREKLAVEAARDHYGHAHKACHEQRDAAWAAIERVRELHYEATHETTWDTARYCEGCPEDWPCPTLQALDGGGTDEWPSRNAR